MFTTQQFAQLAAAAWPAVAFTASVAAHHSVSQQVATTYSVSYSPQLCPTYTGEDTTAFEAIGSAIEQAWASGDIDCKAYRAARTLIEYHQTEAIGAGTCGYCGAPGQRGTCACRYATLARSIHA